jgi:hypothetical protein
MFQHRTQDDKNRHRHQAVALGQDKERVGAHRLSEEAFTLAFYASVGVAGLLSLVGTVAYGYLLLLDLL